MAFAFLVGNQYRNRNMSLIDGHRGWPALVVRHRAQLVHVVGHRGQLPLVMGHRGRMLGGGIELQYPTAVVLCWGQSKNLLYDWYV